MINSDKISIKASVLKSLQNYAKYIGEFGITKSQDKLKLLVMIFLYDTLLNSSYIYDCIRTSNAGFTTSTNKKTVDYIWRVFFNVMDCLRNNSCCVISAESDDCNTCLVDDPEVIGIYTIHLLGTNNLGGDNLEKFLLSTNKETDGEEPDNVEEDNEFDDNWHNYTLLAPNWYDFDNDDLDGREFE